MQRNKKKRSKKIHAIGIVFVLIIFAFLTACGKDEPSKSENNEESGGEARVIKHELGETKIVGVPKRVVALEFSFVDGLWELGVAPVGIAHENPDDVEGLLGKKIKYTSVGTRQQPNLEAISALQPDLIIGDLNRHKDIYKELKKIAPTIILKSRNSTYQENVDSFKMIAETLNKEDEGKERLAKHEEIINKFKKEVPSNDKRTVMLGVFRADSLSAHGSNSFDGELLEKIGINNAIQDAKEPTVNINLEQMVKWDPDVIFLVEADEALLNEWKKNPLWNQITAVKNNQIYEVDRALWTRYRGLKSAERITEEATDILYKQQ
ncbi:ABC transporter substrate-binding protein [Niallia sp. 03133]|uniref:ABC transporter substrate-binding protein n=1 Tax=Niallia sp. 03133 TaxID=3458060 RepID=UPI004044A2C4